VSTLTAACSELNYDAVKMLLDAKACAKGSYPRLGPLYHTILAECTDAQVNHKIAILNLLLDNGASSGSAPDSCEGCTALHECVGAPEETMPGVSMEVLINRNPDLLEQRNDDGWTPLMSAMFYKHREVSRIKVLLDAGADVHTTCTTGTVFHSLFIHFSHHSPRQTRDIARLLLNAGADPTVADAEGVTVLMTILLVQDHYMGCCSDATSSEFDAIQCIFIRDILDYMLDHTGAQ
jgi:ankyrin repeat protein